MHASNRSLLAALLVVSKANSLSLACFEKEHASLATSARCVNFSDKPAIDRLSACIRDTPNNTNAAAAAYIEKCLVDAGCSSEDAVSEASDILDMCVVIDTELRKRSPAILDDLGLGGRDDTGTGSSSSGNARAQPGGGSNSNSDDGGDGSGDTTTAQAAKQTTAKKDTTTAKAAATTVTAKKDTTTATTTTPTTTQETSDTSTPTPTTSIPTTVPTIAAAATTDSTSSPLICMTTTTVSTTHCTTTVTNKHFSSTCYPTVVSFATCAAGLRCSLDQAGSPVCMRTQNELGTSGIVVALAFASAIAVAAALMVFFACKERRRNRRWAKAAEAAEIARIQRKVPAGGRSSTNVAVRSVSGQHGGIDEDRQPLVQAAQGVQYMPPPPVPQDPFTDHQYNVR